MTPWYASPYTGLFTRVGPLTCRPHDPQVALHAGTAAAWSDAAQNLEAGGIGWDAAAAEGACVGEAIERLQAYPLPDDQLVRARYASWPLDEPAVPPERWVLFHAEQYQQTSFPFEPFTAETECGWVCCRQALSGAPIWAPSEFVFLNQPVTEGHRIGPGLSTGLACGRTGDPILLRGLQEVVERDAVMGAWWGRYDLEEYAVADILDLLPPDARARLLRPNLTYRCLRVVSPFSEHVMVVTLTGLDREGWCFSIGAACRETAAAGWTKAIFEAIHGRHYVRHLLTQVAKGELRLGPCPTSFAEHAAWYSLFPQALDSTVLGRATSGFRKPKSTQLETVVSLVERLGPDRPVLFRSLTPPALAAENMDWHVLRVVVPGLQPLHGNHLLPHLGGSHWRPRGWSEWRSMPPHPFP